MNAAVAAGPVVARRLVRRTRLERVRPRARRILARAFAVAVVYLFVGELAAATGITAFAIELGKLVVTRRRP